MDDYKASRKMPYPKVSIRFCTRCKWNLRSAWYVQELLQTFGESLGEVSLIPGESGEFRVLGQLDEHDQEITIWDRKVENGFPDGKFLKQRVRSLLFHDEVSIGKHNERSHQQETLINQENCRACQEI